MSTVKKVVTGINKSYKYDGYAFVTYYYSNHPSKTYSTKRKIQYDRKLRKNKVSLEGAFYSFNWDTTGFVGEDIQFEYFWSDNKISNKIKVEMLEKNIQIPEVDVPEVKEVETVKVDDGEVHHEQYEKILNCVRLNIPVYLVGPAGSGKNHTLEQVAKELELDFYFTNSVQQEYKLTGFIDAGGIYHETEFYKAFTKGGLFFLDEMDASIPEVLVLLNAAIANGYFEFPNGKANANEKFRVVSAGNTVGNGADEQYTGRLVLDQATLDRFAIIKFDYSLRIEMALSKGNTDLVSFIRELRAEAERKGIRATFSYRCITMVTKLESVLKLSEILEMAVVKGFDKDTMRTLNPIGSTKYHQALKELQRVA